MSATLTWQNSGLVTKTGTAINNLIDDIVTLVNSKSGDANFKWQIASSNNAATPYYVVLKRKDASAGRILLVCWTSAPAGNHEVLSSGGAPTTNQLYMTYFPAGNVDTPSNLTASSGTILGDDTGALYCAPGLLVSSIYGANFQTWYFESDAGVVFGFQNPAGANAYWGGAGDLVVDASDNAYPCNFASGGGTMQSFSAATGVFSWVAPGVINMNSNAQRIRVNFGGDNSIYYHAFNPTSSWAAAAAGTSSMVEDTANAKCWFVPVSLLGTRKGEGLVLKWRQIAFGPPTTTQNESRSVAGSVIARQFCGATIGNVSGPWFTNFKV